MPSTEKLQRYCPHYMAPKPSPAWGTSRVGRGCHYDMVVSIVLYGEMQILANCKIESSKPPGQVPGSAMAQFMSDNKTTDPRINTRRQRSGPSGPGITVRICTPTERTCNRNNQYYMGVNDPLERARYGWVRSARNRVTACEIQ